MRTDSNLYLSKERDYKINRALNIGICSTISSNWPLEKYEDLPRNPLNCNLSFP